MYWGENAVYKFMEKMFEEVEYRKGIVKKRFNKPLIMTENDELCFKLIDKCHICSKKYTDKEVHVGDHCHITGKFRGSAHQECNLKLRIKPEDTVPAPGKLTVQVRPFNGTQQAARASAGYQRQENFCYFWKLLTFVGVIQF